MHLFDTCRQRARKALRGTLHILFPARGANKQERLLFERGYVAPRELRRLKRSACSSSLLLGRTINITDSFWYQHSLKEIFADETYRFDCDSEEPYILDCGANIGLSIIYFKQLYPKAHIVAFEPDPVIFGALEANITTFSLSDVVLHRKAVWTHTAEVPFDSNGALGGHIAETSTPAQDVNCQYSVTSTSLLPFLQRTVDFLKMDIEGAEVAVLKECSSALSRVRHLFVEYHSTPNEPQRLDELLHVLRNAEFRVSIKEAWDNIKHPYCHRTFAPTYDLQLNIFAYRR